MIAPTDFLAVGTRRFWIPGRHRGAGRAIGRVLRITEVKESAAMTVPGASTGREYEEGVTGLSGSTGQRSLRA
jgi:hypothetical protein